LCQTLSFVFSALIMIQKKVLSLILGFLVSAFCLWLSFRNIEWHVLKIHLGQIKLPLLFYSSLLYLLSYFIRAFLWQALLGAHVVLSRFRLFQHLIVGVMANNVLPFRLGELVRSYLAGRDAGMNSVFIFSSILVERCLDVLCLLAFTLFVFLHNFSQHWPYDVAYLTAVLFVLALMFLLLMARFGSVFVDWMERYIARTKRSSLLEKIRSLLISFNAGLAGIKHSGRFLQILSLSFINWLVWVVFLYLALAAFDIDIPWSGILMLAGIINLGVLAPSAPGFIGPFQFVCLQGLALFGIGTEKALAFAIVFHAAWYLPSTLLGMLFLWNLRIPVNDLYRIKTISGE